VFWAKATPAKAAMTRTVATAIMMVNFFIVFFTSKYYWMACGLAVG
jgi:hypothetical protein